MGRRKDSVPLSACVGPELFALLEAWCEETGQSKTVAVERAIRAYCSGGREPAPGGKEGGPGER